MAPDKVTHPVRFDPEPRSSADVGNVLEVVGAVFVGGAVQIGGADPLDGLKIVVVVVLAAVEHQMLEEMREAGRARLLVLGADVIPDVHRDDRRLVILVHDQPSARSARTKRS